MEGIHGRVKPRWQQVMPANYATLVRKLWHYYLNIVSIITVILYFWSVTRTAFSLLSMTQFWSHFSSHANQTTRQWEKREIKKSVSVRPFLSGFSYRNHFADKNHGLAREKKENENMAQSILIVVCLFVLSIEATYLKSTYSMCVSALASECDTDSFLLS